VATYYDIHGQKVKNYSSDPSPVASGQVWYNSTSNTSKVRGFSSGTWSSGGALPTAIYGNAGAGTVGAGFSIGGGTGPVPSYVTATNTYNGTAWTGAPALPFSFSLGGGAGPQSTAIAGGGDGNPPGAMATYNGSSWTATPTIGTNVYQMKFVGNSSNAFGAGAYPTAASYNWNGSSWTSATAMPSHNYNTSAVGAHNDAAFFGGTTVSGGSPSNLHQKWNGSSWTTGTVVPVSGGNGGTSSNLAPTSDLWLQANKTTTLIWNGSSWTTVGSMSSGRANAAGSGVDSTSGFIAGGTVPPHTTATEEFTSGAVTQTITTS
tara:strand:+ start:306 stop:1262 length:957 start_codon:yes stop_codon:yes gene_type:complete